MLSIKSITGAVIIVLLLCLTCSYALMTGNIQPSNNTTTQSIVKHWQVPLPTGHIGQREGTDGPIAALPVSKPISAFLLIIGLLGFVGFRRTNSTQFNS